MTYPVSIVNRLRPVDKFSRPWARYDGRFGELKMRDDFDIEICCCSSRAIIVGGFGIYNFAGPRCFQCGKPIKKPEVIVSDDAKPGDVLFVDNKAKFAIKKLEGFGEVRFQWDKPARKWWQFWRWFE